MGTEQQPSKKSSTGLDENLAGLLTYVAGWLTGIIFLVIEKDSKFVKYHAWQSIITFGGLTVITVVVGFIPVVRIFSGLLSLVGLVAWVLLMYKAFQGEMYKLPMIGDLAEKQVNK
jgi:uncharacterized membrane protein